METKMCTKCLEIKPLDEFYKDVSRPDGKLYDCKRCRWQRNILRERKRHYLRHYGITLEAVQQMAKDQNHKCLLCNRDCLLGDSRGVNCFHVDHCHKTGKVRGLLCSGCNKGIGYFYDSPAALRMAADYVELHSR